MTAISGSTTLVGILGWPVEHSLSPRMHNAAFAAFGLDWVYTALPTPPDRLEDAVRGIVALGFAGVNVTTPHKLAVTELCETDEPSVNTLVVRDGLVTGYSTDAAVLDGLPAERPVVLGSGGTAAAFLRALPHARQFSRRGTWPPDVRDADLIVNATSERDEVLVELGSPRRSSTFRIPRPPRPRPHAEPERASSRPRRAARARRLLVRALDGRLRAGRRDEGRTHRIGSGPCGSSF